MSFNRGEVGQNKDTIFPKNKMSALEKVTKFV